MRSRLAALMVLAAGLALPPALHAQASAEVAALLQRAEFWQARQRDDRAREELDKALRLVPDQPEALVMLARMQLRANQDAEATATFERLRRAHPRHPGTAQVGTLLRIRGPDRDRLRQARQLARAGRNDEALAAFRAIFPDGPPDDEHALEIASVQGWTRDGWEPARAALAELARRHPDDARYQVAHWSHMSTRKPASAETLKALRELSAHENVLIARQAREAWRRAVIAMDAVPETVPILREYIAANPGETAVKERLDAVTQAIAQGKGGAAAAVTDPATRARIEGWAAIEANRLDEAEAKLREAMAKAPKDGEAVAGLGLVRMRQGRHAEALELFERAGSKWDGLARTARYWVLLGEARKAREAGQLTVAEARAKEARALDPKEPNAAMELARVHVAAGRDRDAEALLAELEPDQQRAIRGAIDEVRAGRLREEAGRHEAAGQAADAIAALERAAALDRDSPWVRHDLARLYAARGEPQRGRDLFDELLRRRPNDADVRYAQALFLSSAGHELEAMAALERIPARERSANMTSLQRRLWMTLQGRRAEALAESGKPKEAEAILASMRAAAAGDRAAAETVAQIERDMRMRRSRELRDAGRHAEAAEIYRALLREAPAEREAQLGLIDTLIEQRDYAAARALAAQVLRERPNDARALSMAATIALREQRLDEALKLERHALAIEDRGEAWRYRRLAEMIDPQLAWYSGAIDWLYRSGTPGKSRVSAQELPAAWRQGWTPGGRWYVRAAPARVSAGTLQVLDDYETNTFGTLLLCQPNCGETAIEQTEKGLALGAGFERGPWRFDLGTGPIGFPVVNLLGGVAYRGEWGPMSYTIDASRRAVPSSLLSYAGTRDPNTGRTWGGVTQNGVRVNVSRDSGGDYGAWGLVGLYRLAGRNVLDNDKAELMAGMYRRFINEEDRLLTLGVTAMLWHFTENAGEYTFGHGGYYSPGNYQSLAFPLAYGWRTPRSAFSLRASVSVAWSKSRRAPFYPTEPELQAQAEALVPTSFLDPFYEGGSNGRSYGRSFAAAGEHQLAPNVFLGARIDIERSTNYTPSRFLVYVRFTLDGSAARPVALPPEPQLPGLQY